MAGRNEASTGIEGTASHVALRGISPRRSSGVAHGEEKENFDKAVGAKAEINGTGKAIRATQDGVESEKSNVPSKARRNGLQGRPVNGRGRQVVSPPAVGDVAVRIVPIIIKQIGEGLIKTI